MPHKENENLAHDQHQYMDICVTIKRLIFLINNINFNDYHGQSILTTSRL